MDKGLIEEQAESKRIFIEIAEHIIENEDLSEEQRNHITDAYCLACRGKITAFDAEEENLRVEKARAWIRKYPSRANNNIIASNDANIIIKRAQDLGRTLAIEEQEYVEEVEMAKEFWIAHTPLSQMKIRIRQNVNSHEILHQAKLLGFERLITIEQTENVREFLNAKAFLLETPLSRSELSETENYSHAQLLSFARRRGFTG